MNFREILNQKKYLNDIKVIDKYTYTVNFEMRNDYQIPLIIAFNSLYPARLPYVYIDKKNHHIPDMPHIMRNGMICFLDKEGVLWSNDSHRTIDFVFERVEKVLLENSPHIEFHREFSYYFGTLKDTKAVMSVYTPEANPQEISLLKIKKRPFAFLKDDEESKSVLSRLLKTNIKSRNLDKAFFIPLDYTYKESVPQLDRFWSNEEIVKIVKQHTTKDTLLKIKEFNTNKQSYFYLLSIPLLTEEQAIIGLQYDKIDPFLSRKANPLIEEDCIESFKVTPLFVFRNDDTTLVERGGGIKENPNILLVGCGSIGSDLLFLLARSGLKKFTLIDNDELEMENSYRHFLGMDKAVTNKSKVELLKKEMENRYPKVHIKTINSDILESLEEKSIDLDTFDLIIIAIGDPNIEREVNKFILKSSTPSIFTWVEAYGIGGHALMINNGPKGCYECLISKELQIYSSFAGKSDVPFIKNMNGCAGSFTPYGSVDSMETALLASRMVLRYLDNDIKGNPLVSWKGSAKKFETGGFVTSERYNLPLDTLNNYNYNYINDECECCSEWRSSND
ncbi:ThiF family adenylyltransferase (plasmid) [Priestia filamentosa]|nr:ThiF family adenylyltransferase [Priestia filamentosa]